MSAQRFNSADDYVDSFDHDFHEAIIDDKAIAIRPMTTAEIFVACKRIPKFKRFLQDSSTLLYGNDQSVAEVLAARFNGPTLVEVALDAGLDAVACFIACCLNRPHNEVFEQKLLSKPDTFLLPLFSRCKDITLGGRSIDDFFTEKLKLLNLMGLMELGKEPKAPKQMSEPVAEKVNQRKGRKRKGA